MLQAVGDDLAETGLDEEEEMSATPGAQQFAAEGAGAHGRGVDIIDLAVADGGGEAPLELPPGVEGPPECG